MRLRQKRALLGAGHTMAWTAAHQEFEARFQEHQQAADVEKELRSVTKALKEFGYNKVCRGVAQPGSAPALGAGGRRFKSSRPDHSTQQSAVSF